MARGPQRNVQGPRPTCSRTARQDHALSAISQWGDQRTNPPDECMVDEIDYQPRVPSEPWATKDQPPDEDRRMPGPCTSCDLIVPDVSHIAWRKLSTLADRLYNHAPAHHLPPTLARWPTQMFPS